MDTAEEPEDDHDDNGNQKSPEDELTPVEVELSSGGVLAENPAGLEEVEEETSDQEDQDKPEESVHAETVRLDNEKSVAVGLTGNAAGESLKAVASRGESSRKSARKSSSSGVHCF